MEDRPVLCRVDVISTEHCGTFRRQPGAVGEIGQCGEDLVGDEVLRQIDVEIAGGDRHAPTPLRIVGEQLPE